MQRSNRRGIIRKGVCVLALAVLGGGAVRYAKVIKDAGITAE